MFNMGDLLVCQTRSDYRPAFSEIVIFLGWLTSRTGCLDKGVDKDCSYNFSSDQTHTMMIYTQSGFDWAPIGDGWRFDIIGSINDVIE